jgi:hypothetical protein
VRRPVGFLAALAVLSALAWSPKPTPTPAGRRVAVRYGDGMSVGPSAFMTDVPRARRASLAAVDLAAEGAPVPKGAEIVHLCVIPSCDAVKAYAARLPVSFEPRAFTFDGRTYSGEEDAILLADPARPGEIAVAGLSLETVVRLAQRRVYQDGPPGNYVVVSGERVTGLRKTGRFTASDGGVAIDRASDEDQIAERDAFFGSLAREKKGVVTCECAPSEKAACAKWQPVAAKFAGKKPFTVRIFPDAMRKARYTGSSRPASVVVSEGAVRVEIDATAPGSPDLITPALAAAAAAAARPQLAERPILLQAIGARRVGTWWGRDVKSFGAFALSAHVEPSVEEVLSNGQGVSTVLAVGAAASWLDAGARLESEADVEKALAGKDAALVAALARWRAIAWRQPVKPPARRELPDGFLRGVSYEMRRSLDAGYLSPASAKALERLRDLGATSVSIAPSVLTEADSTALDFVHDNPLGDTDEAIVRAVLDARALGLTAMIKPQVFVQEAYLGLVSVSGEAAWRDWFQAYRRFAVHYAIVAEASGAAIFCAGAGLTATEAHEKEWRNVFSALHLATGAPLVYAANGAARVADITFWDALDAIGADLFDPLGRGNEKLSDAALEQAARRAALPLAETSRKYSNRPVILTEAGYPLVRAAWLSPRDEGSALPYATDDATRCVAAVYRALGKEPWWKGVYWAKAYSDGAPAVAGERGLHFIGTPVEKAIVEGWKAMAPR